MQGDTGPVTLKVEASLEDVEDPVASQIRALNDIVQPIKVSLLPKNSSNLYHRSYMGR